MDIDVFSHNLSPKYRIIDLDEVDSLLLKYKITKKELPKMLLDDASSQKLGAKEGDVVEIIRKSKTAGESKYYRLVVK